MQVIGHHASDWWNDKDSIVILDSNQGLIAEFPLSFVRTGGINTWMYVIDVVKMLLQSPTEFSLVNAAMRPIDQSGMPSPGVYSLSVDGSLYILYLETFTENRMSGAVPTVVFARGPENSRKYAAADLSSDRSTVSRSKSGGSTRQVRFHPMGSYDSDSVLKQSFRTAVIARDSQCLITEADYPQCTACHIVPQSREDVNGLTRTD